MRLLGFQNAKTIKGEIKGWLTGIIYLSPWKMAGINVCANATDGCISACLNTAGRGAMSNIQDARLKKTLLFKENPKAFVAEVSSEISKLKKKNGGNVAIRLNGTSDIPYENIKIDGSNIMEMHSDVVFYDYTKDWKRMDLDIPNYHLTYSRAETEFSKYQASRLIRSGKNVAMVFSKELYTELVDRGYVEVDGVKIPVIDGDEDDLRFLDPKGCIVALKAKGKAVKDTSGFVIRSIEEI